MWVLVVSMIMLGQVAAVDLGPDFVEAEARTARVNSDRIQLTLSVVTFPEAVVVAHLIEPGGEQETVAMSDSDEGVYQGTVELRPVDYVVVFEVITPGPRSVQSNPVRLTQIGVAPTELVVPIIGDEKEEDLFRWVWLALGAGALALALVTLTYLPKKREEAQTESEPEAEPVSS